MADDITSSSVVSLGGYDSSLNHFNMDTNAPGRASDLLNYEVGLNGGYRRINGYMKFDLNFPSVDDTNAEGRIFGVAIYKDNNGVDQVFATRKQIGSNTYKFYKYSNTLGWVAQTTGITHNTISGSKTIVKVRHATFSFGGVSYIIFVDGVNPAVLYNGTNWYSLLSTNTGGTGSPGGDQLIDSPAAVAVFKNHIFLSRDPADNDIVVHSAPLDPFTWTAAAGGGQLPTGFKVSQIKPFRDQLFVFGYNEISHITVSGDSFVINDTTKNIGCIAPDSVLEISGDLLFLGPDGIRPVSATERNDDYQLASISKQIQYFLTEDIINSYNLETLDAVVIRTKSQFRYFVSRETIDATGRGVIGGIRSAGNNDSGGWEFGRLQGIRCSSVTSGFINNREVVIHGDYDGKVYQQELGNSFDGSNIISIYETPFLTFGDAKVRKELRTVSTYYRLEGSLEININLIFDWGDSKVLNPPTFVQSNISDVSVYGDGSMYGDGSTYASTVISPLIQQDIEGSFHSVKISYSTSDQNPPHSIQGFVLEYTTQARR